MPEILCYLLRVLNAPRAAHRRRCVQIWRLLGPAEQFRQSLVALDGSNVLSPLHYNFGHPFATYNTDEYLSSGQCSNLSGLENSQLKLMLSWKPTPWLRWRMSCQTLPPASSYRLFLVSLCIMASSFMESGTIMLHRLFLATFHFSSSF